MANNGLFNIYQVFVNVSEVCYQKGITHFILSPGSRSAILALVFLRHPNIKTYTITDERAAAFKALGMAKALNQPVGLICTSGTAALNYAPAIAEAFWQEVPLIAFTADRPPEWITQGENQTIFQENLYGPNVKASFTFPDSPEKENYQWQIYRQLNEAIDVATSVIPGPVQINAPFHEPLYPEGFDLPEPDSQGLVFKKEKTKKALGGVTQSMLMQEIKSYQSIAVMVGLYPPNEVLVKAIRDFIYRTRAILIVDPVSNCHAIEEAIPHADLHFSKALNDNNPGLSPELLISVGGPMVSKALKEYFRRFKPNNHWHISASGTAPDIFQSLTKIIPTSPETFFQDIGGGFWPKDQNDYQHLWLKSEEALEGNLKTLLDQKDTFSEVRVFQNCLNSIEQGGILYLGNSQPVRHAQFIGVSSKNLSESVQVFANRGTSGIDGVLSTAMGHSLISDQTVTVILGDLAFMYDRNALWQENLPTNLQIIILNNGGGGIFRTLEGAKAQPELESYFASAHSLSFEETARQHQCHYHSANDWSSLDEGLKESKTKTEGPFILEIQFDKEENIKDQQSLRKEVLEKIPAF